MYGKKIKLSVEHKEALRKSNIGKKHSDETKKKWSEIRSGKPAWNKGVSMSDETKKKMSLAKIGKPSNNKK